MRAVWMREFGPPEVLIPGEAPESEPGPGQLLVAVVAAGVTFVETQVRAGRSPRPGAGPRLPMIPGNGVAGEVVAVGPGVDRRRIGERVVTTTGGQGGYAEMVAVEAANLIPVPADLDLPEAVALLADGRTALALMRVSRAGAGEHVLVEAAGGGVGTLLVQLARNAGAHVIAAASEPRKLDLARDLGAAFTVNYSEPDWPDRVREATNGAGIDVAFDGVGGAIGRAAFELLAPGGRFVVFGLASGSITQVSLSEVLARGVSVVGGGQIRSAEDMRELSAAAIAEAAAGRLRPIIGQTFPLERAADAHAAIEARATLGKTMLIC